MSKKIEMNLDAAREFLRDTDNFLSSHYARFYSLFDASEGFLGPEIEDANKQYYYTINRLVRRAITTMVQQKLL